MISPDVSQVSLSHGSKANNLAPSIVLLWISPIWMQLTVVLLDDNVVVVLCHLLAILVVVYTLLAVAFNHPLSQNLDSLDRNLTLSGALLCRLQVFQRVHSTTSLKKSIRKTLTSEMQMKKV